MLLLLIKGIENISSKNFFLEATLKANEQLEDNREPKIVVNQIGYYPDWSKSALVLNAANSQMDKAELINCQTKKKVLDIQIAKQIKDEASQDVIQTVNFTKFHRPGCYYLKAGNIQSAPFQIGKDIYQQPLIKLLHSYYLQRCGTAVDDRATGIHHATCHLNDGIIAHDDAIHHIGEELPALGGWHDAGDYGKYLATTTVTVGSLLRAYEQAPSIFKNLQLAIPESGNSIPDILDEVKVGLNWMLKMQRADGAVYRKLSGKEWPFDKTPDRDTQPRYIYGISTPETAKFAAAMAMAARIYAVEPEFAKTCLNAAQKAWTFLQTIPEMKVEYYPDDDSGSGKYLSSEIDTESSLKTDKDDRFWAAAELWITTGDSSFEKYLAENVVACDYTLFDWKNACSLGMTDYLFHPKGSKDLKKVFKAKVIERAENLLKNVEASGYNIAIDRFIWGSNNLIIENAITLLYAYQLTGKRTYRVAAIDQVAYVLGRNHFNKSFVTGVGTNPVQHVDHLFARAAKIDIPGLLVDGPNNGAQDGIAPKNRGPLSYVDDERSYATNEFAIDYNSSLIALIGLLMQAEN